jgi:hypothetical protein
MRTACSPRLCRVRHKPHSWSCGHIKRLVELGITQGFPGGEYRPYADVNREQMAAFLARAFLGMQ